MIDITTLLGDIATVQTVVPQLQAAYLAYKAIWTVVNPGKTEAEYEQHLLELSTTAISAADAILLADGYTKDASGKWTKGV